MTTRTELSCALGVDLGTSAIKVVAVSRDGRMLATARECYRTITTCRGQAEQNCADWLKALSRASKKVHTQTGRKLQVAAIGLAGQMPTLVVLNGNRPVGHAITWQDSRADDWASERLSDEVRNDIYRRTGVVIDGRYLAPMFRFHRPKPTSGDVILSAKDFLLHALTGESVTDPSTAAGYGLYNLESGAWDIDLSRFWNLSVEQLPSLRSSSSSLPLSRRGSKLMRCVPGTPVVVGCADSAAGAYALNGGTPANDTITILTGSSTVIIKPDTNPQWDPQRRYLVTPLALDRSYGREADLLASGSARDWLQNLLAGSEIEARKALWQAARELAPGADGLLFAPYLSGGEQGVLWNPDLTGALTGLRRTHQAAHLARALLEGMLCEIRRCLEGFGAKPISAVRITGWMAESAADVQILADILGRAVRAYKLESASAVGAALLTGFVDQEDYFNKTKASVVRPRAKHSRRYTEVYARYIAQFPATSCGVP